jgi:hypothetical protein
MERSASEFVVKICSKVSANAFTSSSVAVTVFPLTERSKIFRFMFVTLLLAFSLCKICCQVFGNCLIAESVFSFKELTRGRRVISCRIFGVLDSVILCVIDHCQNPLESASNAVICFPCVRSGMTSSGSVQGVCKVLNRYINLVH